MSRLYELSRMPLTFAMTETLSGLSLYFTRMRQPSRTQGFPPSPRERVSKLSFITTEVVYTGRAVMTNNGKLYDYATGDEMRDKNMAGAAGVYIPVQTIPLATRTLSVSSSGV